MNLSALYAELNQSRAAGDHKRALELGIRLVEIVPDDPSVRLALAGSLLDLGEREAAAGLYRAIAWHFSKAGFPLVAIAAAKRLAELEPGEEIDVLEVVVGLYGRDSDRVGPPGMPFRPPTGPSRNEDLGDLADSGLSLADLALKARTVGESMDGCAEFPELLPAIPIFSQLHEDAFQQLLEAMTVHRFTEGETVMKQGDPGESIYLIADGRVRVFRTLDDGSHAPLASLNEGAVFGEMAVITAEPRSASVTVLRRSLLLKLRRDDLLALADKLLPVAEALEGFRRERMVYNLMATSPLFKPFDREERFKLLNNFGTFEVAGGTDLLTEGQPAQGLYLVLHGECLVHKNEEELARLHEGDVFGEISLLREQPANATVLTAQDSVILFLAREVFATVAENHPEVMDVLDELAEERVRAKAPASTLEVETEDDNEVMV